VVARDAEFAQQHIEALGFGNEHRRAQPVAQVVFLLGQNPQQILGKQNAEYIVAVAIDHREAGVRRIDDQRHQFIDGHGHINHIHLGAGNHDVGDTGFGRSQCALDNGQGVGIHQVLLEGAVQQFEKLLAIFRFAQQQGSESFEKVGLVRTRGGVHA